MSNIARTPHGWHPEPSSSLLAGLGVNDPRAWQRLLEWYAPAVRRWLRRHGLDEDAADDAVQEVFQALARNVANFGRGRGSLVAWVFSSARTKFIGHVRRQKRQPEAAGGSSAQERLEQAPAPADSWSDDAARERAWKKG